MKCESKIKHSRFSQNKFMIFVGGVILLYMAVGMPASVQAQMFSVGENRPDFRVPLTELYVGYEPADVTFEGETMDSRAGVFAFEGAVLRAGYRSRMLNLHVGTGGRITGLDNIGYFDFGGNVDVGIPAYQSRPVSLQIPIRLDSRFTNITNNATFDRFRFGSLTAGAGVKVMARHLPTFRFEAGVIPSYGFSFASGGIFGGSMGSVAAETRIYLDRLFEDIGLSIGYKYDLRNYDIDEEIYDYRINAHSIQVGITF